MIYGVEVMTMTKKNEEKLNITEKIKLRTVLRPVKIAENE